MTFAEFIAMNGHGAYVWSSYGLGLLVFLVLFFSMRAQRNKLVTQIRRKNRQTQKKTADTAQLHETV